MANLLQAISAYGPKIQTNQTVGLKEAARFIAMRTSMNPSEASAMLQELSTCVLFFNNQGTPLKLPGLGIFSPSVNRHGERKINIRVDSSLKRGINNDEEFTARMRNKNNSTLSNEDYKALWDADHPADPLEI